MIRAIYKHEEPIPANEILLRDEIAKTALQAWRENTSDSDDIEEKIDHLESLHSDLSNFTLARE